METVGSLIDKLSINELKIYHMEEQKEREDTDSVFKSDCEMRLSILKDQREDLKKELQGYMDDILSGQRVMKPFRQMKMYNEKKYKD